MSTYLFQHGLLGLVRLLATAAVTGWVSSPMSWSPDSRWLAYTAAPESGADARQAAGLLGPSPRPAPADADAEDAPEAAGGGLYRIWASRRDGSASVVVEESSTPITAPRWGPRGRSLAFGHFVPEAGSPSRGRVDVVVRDGLERRRVLLTLPGFELEEVARAHFPDLAPAWSPDGQFLAFPTPTAILIVRIESRRVVQTLDRCLLPAWSPDGSKLAFLHRDDAESYSLRLVDRAGRSFSGPRELRRIGGIAAPIGWGADGRSILAVLERARIRPEVDLARVVLDDPAPAPRVFSLVPEVVRRLAAIRGIAIDFDRNEELCFFSTDLEGRDTDVCWSVPRDQLPYRRFHPIDPSMRIAGLAIAPDNHAVAMRFGPPEALSPPAVVELETEHIPPTEHTTLIVADESARRAWLGLLGQSARSLLSVATPPIVIDGRPIGRPTVLPLPGEAADTPPIRSRFARIGRYGSSLAAGRGAPTTRRDWEERLFFDYLKGDYAAAADDLDGLEARVASREHRLALLALRAQILWARGDADGARAVASYLVEALGGPVYRVEETPIGRSLVPEPDAGSGRDWARYLASRAGQPPEHNPRAAATATADHDDPLMANPFAPNPPGGMDFPRERGVGDALPFAPELQDPRHQDIQAQLRALQRFIEQQRRAQGQGRPR